MTNHIIIGIDHSYGNIKTASCCFRTGVTLADGRTIFTNDILQFEGHSYIIGEGHKEFSADKMLDQDYYLLTLAAIGRELHICKMSSARVWLAVGLPLTWVSQQKERFWAYLLQRSSVDFTFRDKEYHVAFAGCDVFPQGFAAVAHRLKDFRGVNMLCDIGNGTMNLMYINNRKPMSDRCFTEKFGVYQCILAVRENMMRCFGVTVDDTLIEQILRTGTADIGEKYLTVIRDTAREYVAGILRRLREHGYAPDMMRLHIVGGGSCLMKHFGQFAPECVTITEDICATAKGYEFLARSRAESRC